MHTYRSNSQHVFRLRPLAACLAIAAGANVLAGTAVADRDGTARLAARTHEERDAGSKSNPEKPASQIRTVTACLDGAPNSLRDIITNVNNPNHAQPGDIVDLSELQTWCGTADSTLTLTNGEIPISQSDLTLRGPAPGEGTVTISGGGLSRIFKHSGGGALSILDLKLTNGYYRSAGGAYGGCIESTMSGSVYLHRTVVTNCKALSDANVADGGAIRTSGAVTLVASTVSDSQALGPTTGTFGGGIFAGTLQAVYSSISTNVAGDGPLGGGKGGGVFLLGNGASTITASTIDHNTSTYGAGLVVRGPMVIVNSTISGNTAHKSVAGVFSQNASSLSIYNSTIAFNHGDIPSSYAAVHFKGTSPASPLNLQSSIIASNTVTAMNIPYDLSVNNGTLGGTDNLIVASGVVDPVVITVTLDPKLGPLQSNGGPTRTHGLLPGSPAFGVGNRYGLAPTMTNDQRGQGYPRSVGSGPTLKTDIGAVESDPIFSDGFEP